MTKLTDEELDRFCHSPHSNVAAMATELRDARAQLAKMGAVYEAAIKWHKQLHRQWGEGWLDAVIEHHLEDDSPASADGSET